MSNGGAVKQNNHAGRTESKTISFYLCVILISLWVY